MNKTAIAILGSVSAVALAGGAQASTAANPSAEFPQPARSFAELLDPIPNAAAVLEASNAQTAASQEASMQLAQVYIGSPPHHHHPPPLPAVLLRFIIITTIITIITILGFTSLYRNNLAGLSEIKSAEPRVHVGAVRFAKILVERAGLHDLHEGQKIAYEVVADRRTGKSSADNLKPV